MELTEHLAELRTRIMRSLLFLIVGTIIAYQFFQPLYHLLSNPLKKEMTRLNVEQAKASGNALPPLPVQISEPPTKAEVEKLKTAIQYLWDHPAARPIMSPAFRSFHEAFMVRLKISMVFGLILVLPMVLWELALFVTPALTPQERRPLRLLAPISVLLLIFGVTIAYFTMFFAMRWFLSYLGDFDADTILMQDPNEYVLFFLKMMAAFGIAFQLPVVLMGGAFICLITSQGLAKHWRWGVVIAALGGLFTPSNDLFSMALMSIPLLILYFLSILLVKVVERMKKKHAKE